MSNGQHDMKKHLHEFDNDLMEVCEQLHKGGTIAVEYLVNCVASVCGVEPKEMMTTRYKASCCHARWLFYYAYRFMTNESYSQINRLVREKYNTTYIDQTVAQSVYQFGMLMADDDTWKRRWLYIKAIIKGHEIEQPKTSERKLTITIPKELKGKVDIKYSE